jgi:hypothetical protein
MLNSLCLLYQYLNLLVYQLAGILYSIKILHQAHCIYFVFICTHCLSGIRLIICIIGITGIMIFVWQMLLEGRVNERPARDSPFCLAERSYVCGNTVISRGTGDRIFFFLLTEQSLMDLLGHLRNNFQVYF